MQLNAAANQENRRRTAWLLLSAICFCLLLGWLAYQALFGIYLDNERRLAAQRLDAFALSLEATLSRHESLPSLLALDPTLAGVLREPDNPQRVSAANAYLEAAQQGANVAVTFLIDARGKTIAASNWRQPRTFIGQNYGFRPYFRDALQHGSNRAGVGFGLGWCRGGCGLGRGCRRR
jgi:two-component system, NtrC family, C4-dicarboxylate transport sensor histidine kinase DctB